jgi:hypothetical protein
MPSKSKIPQKSFRVNKSIVISGVAVFISICALVITVIHIQLETSQLKSSVWPRLALKQNSNQEGDSAFSFSIENKGVGPAIIKKQEFGYKGKNYPNFYEVIKAIMPDSIKSLQYVEDIKTKVFVQEDVLKAGENHIILKLPENPILTNWISSAQNEIFSDPAFIFRITYSDIYGNCWMLDKYLVVEIGSCE